jgi:hypothetical protein
MELVAKPRNIGTIGINAVKNPRSVARLFSRDDNVTGRKYTRSWTDSSTISEKYTLITNSHHRSPFLRLL